MLQAVAEGAGEGALRDLGHYRTSRSALQGVAALGRRLNDGVPIRWTAIVHRAATSGAIAVESRPRIWVSEFQLDLLRAWAKGLSLDTYAYEAGLERVDAWERAVFLHIRLQASGDQQAVLRAHQMQVLTADDPLHVTFNAGGS
ncbi:hypothetical protein ABZV77_05240 [Streptomyces sp. NPDC004732]|uniref:hypothetical protein n=1 Tax=Streptomyces sp. NPDC004732 TaxID=3154290 RepID=UPI0033AEDF01